MKISVVTPSFNQGAFIEEAIQSVADQGDADVEHIIVDNCSTDQTPEVLARYPHLKVICEPDKGQSDALNKGFRAASGDIVGWLNADDRYLPGCFEAVIKAFNDNSGYDLVYGDYRFVDVAGRVLCLRRELPFDLFMLKYLHVLYIPSTTTFFKRKVFEAGNFLDAGYHYAMDYEFFVRLAQAGYKFVHVPKILADYRWHAGAKSSRATAKQKEEMEKALLVHDKMLSALPGTARILVRTSLMAAARVTRSTLKLFRGAYFSA